MTSFSYYLFQTLACLAHCETNASIMFSEQAKQTRMQKIKHHYCRLLYRVRIFFCNEMIKTRINYMWVMLISFGKHYRKTRVDDA